MTPEEFRAHLLKYLPKLKERNPSTPYYYYLLSSLYLVFNSCMVHIYHVDTFLKSEKTDEEILDYLVKHVIYFGPLTTTITISKAINLSEVKVTTRENYKKYTNPVYFREELFNDDNFWKEEQLVMYTPDCLHFPNAKQTINALFPKQEITDNTRHYNSYYYPLNIQGYIGMYGFKAKIPDPEAAKLFT